MSSSSTHSWSQKRCVMFRQPAARCTPEAQAQPCSTQKVHVFSPGCPGIALQIEWQFFLLTRPHEWSGHSCKSYTCHKHVQAATAATACALTSMSLCILALVNMLLGFRLELCDLHASYRAFGFVSDHTCPSGRYFCTCP